MQTLKLGFRGEIFRGPLGQLTKNLLKLISRYSKDAAFRVNIEKSIAISLLHTSDERLVVKVRKIPFIFISLLQMEYLGINLIKHIKDLK